MKSIVFIIFLSFYALQADVMQELKNLTTHLTTLHQSITKLPKSKELTKEEKEFKEKLKKEKEQLSVIIDNIDSFITDANNFLGFDWNNAIKNYSIDEKVRNNTDNIIIKLENSYKKIEINLLDTIQNMYAIVKKYVLHDYDEYKYIINHELELLKTNLKSIDLFIRSFYGKEQMEIIAMFFAKQAIKPVTKFKSNITNTIAKQNTIIYTYTLINLLFLLKDKNLTALLDDFADHQTEVREFFDTYNNDLEMLIKQFENISTNFLKIDQGIKKSLEEYSERAQTSSEKLLLLLNAYGTFMENKQTIREYLHDSDQIERWIKLLRDVASMMSDFDIQGKKQRYLESQKDKAIKDYLNYGEQTVKKSLVRQFSDFEKMKNKIETIIDNLTLQKEAL